MSDDTKNRFIAVCNDCGKTWKIRNTATDNHKRKCGHCKSENIRIETEPPAPETSTNNIPALDELAGILNAEPAPATPENNKDNTRDNNPQLPEKPTGFFPKIHPALFVMIFVLLLSFGAFLYFRRRLAKPRKNRRHETKERIPAPEKERKPEPAKRIGIVGL